MVRDLRDLSDHRRQVPYRPDRMLVNERVPDCTRFRRNADALSRRLAARMRNGQGLLPCLRYPSGIAGNCERHVSKAMGYRACAIAMTTTSLTAPHLSIRSCLMPATRIWIDAIDGKAAFAGIARAFDIGSSEAIRPQVQLSGRDQPRAGRAGGLRQRDRRVLYVVGKNQGTCLRRLPAPRAERGDFTPASCPARVASPSPCHVIVTGP